MKIGLNVQSVQFAVRAGSAAGLSVALAGLLRLEFPLVAIIAAVLTTDLQARRTRELGKPRLIGNGMGAIVGAVLTIVLGSSALSVGFGVLTAILVAHLFNMKEAAQVAGYVCGLALLNHGEAPWVYVLHRTAETTLGIGLAVLTGYVPKLLPRSWGPQG